MHPFPHRDIRCRARYRRHSPIFVSTASFLRKVGPNQALIVYGTGGIRIIHGGAHLVLPMVQRAREVLSELMSFDVAPYARPLYHTRRRRKC